jgi:hypothetical protein
MVHPLDDLTSGSISHASEAIISSSCDFTTKVVTTFQIPLYSIGLASMNLGPREQLAIVDFPNE